MWKSGDAGKAKEAEEEEEEGHVKQAILVGVDAHTLLSAQKFLASDWNVILYDRDQEKLNRAVVYLENLEPKEEDFASVFSFQGLQNAIENSNAASATGGSAVKAGRRASAPAGSAGSAAATPATGPDANDAHAVPALSIATAAQPHADADAGAGAGAGEAQAAAEEEDEEEHHLVAHHLAAGDIVTAFEQVSAELLDARAHATNIAIVHLNADEDAVQLALFFKHTLKVPRVIVKVLHPACGAPLAAHGIIPLNDFALQRFVLTELTVNEHGPAAMVPDAAIAPLADSVLHWLDSDSADERPDLLGLADAERAKRVRECPAPGAQFWSAMAQRFAVTEQPKNKDD